MKTIIKYLIAILILSVGLVWGFKCVTSRPPPNPLAGWHFSSLSNLHSNKAITTDYQDYIQKLSLKENEFVGSISFFEDGKGQHAVDIQIGSNGTWWEHVLIYDVGDKRVKVIKYSNGGYRS